MALDVVLSRQRRYATRVTPLLNDWLQIVADQTGSPTLHRVSDNPDSYQGLPLRSGEAATIAGVVAGLRRFASDHVLDKPAAVDAEDIACEQWAAGTAGLELAPKLDPYVGSVKA